MNQASTRSHCIFTIHITSRESGSATIRRAKLHLVDLAGYMQNLVYLYVDQTICLYGYIYINEINIYNNFLCFRSERVSKTGVNGVLLTEAKYINLSLHYLEQVSESVLICN